MTDTKQEKPKNLMPSSFSQAFLAGVSSAAVSYVIGVPLEFVPRVAVAGVGYSLFRSWQDSRYLTAPKKPKPRGRQIPFNHKDGSQNINMEFSIAQGGHIFRESYWQGFKKFIFGNPKPANKQIERIDKPKILDEFYFVSIGIHLRKTHVDLFLKSAWRNRKYGRGLSTRHWVRNFSQRPAWYRELSPTWYFAMMRLLYNAQIFTDCQLVITLDNQQSFLAVEPYHLIRILKWYEYEKYNITR